MVWRFLLYGVRLAGYGGKLLAWWDELGGFCSMPLSAILIFLRVKNVFPTFFM